MPLEACAELVGRSLECTQLERLLTSARDGQSAVLVLRGATGTGKSELLRHTAERAEDFHVVRTDGVGFPESAELTR